ncbi:MAG: hypothetical protein WAV18_33170 [Roseiarcus sp.]
MALTPFVDQRESVTFIAITIYISLTALFLAAVVADAAAARMATIRSGYMVAAMLGIIGYFNVGGLGPYFTLYENLRAAGSIQGPQRVRALSRAADRLALARPAVASWPAPADGVEADVLMLAVMLSFSRGAITACVASLILLLGLTFATASSSSERRRTVVVAVLCATLIVVSLSIILGIPSIREMALSRASLARDYDVGEEGRFGNQLRAICSSDSARCASAMYFRKTPTTSFSALLRLSAGLAGSDS